MKDGLAARWIGLHAAAFALHVFCSSVLYNLKEWSWPHLTAALSLGVPLAGAQLLASWDRPFPARETPWILASVMAVGFSSWFGIESMSIFLRTVLIPLGKTRPGWERGLGYAMVVVMLSTHALALGFIQACALYRRVPIRTAVLWGLGVAAAWFSAEFLTYVAGWSGVLPGPRLPSVIDLGTAVLWMSTGALQGGVFGLLTLPAVRVLTTS